jgi:hypothetical protein
MASGTSILLLRFNASGFRRPGFASANVENPKDFVNPDERILCIAAFGIRRNTTWITVLSRGDHRPSMDAHDKADQQRGSNEVVVDLTSTDDQQPR